MAALEQTPGFMHLWAPSASLWLYELMVCVLFTLLARFGVEHRGAWWEGQELCPGWKEHWTIECGAGGLHLWWNTYRGFCSVSLVLRHSPFSWNTHTFTPQHPVTTTLPHTCLWVYCYLERLVSMVKQPYHGELILNLCCCKSEQLIADLCLVYWILLKHFNIS